MKCYLCDHDFYIPKDLHAIVACPGCKKDIITDGTPNEEISSLYDTIDSLNSEISFCDKEIKSLKLKLNQADVKIKALEIEIQSKKINDVVRDDIVNDDRSFEERLENKKDYGDKPYRGGGRYGGYGDYTYEMSQYGRKELGG